MLHCNNYEYGFPSVPWNARKMENRKNLEANDPVSPEGDVGSRNERTGFFPGTSDEDVLGIIDTYTDFFSLLAEQPWRFLNPTFNLGEHLVRERSASYAREAGDATSETQKKDKRFRSDQWDENPLFKELKDTCGWKKIYWGLLAKSMV